MKLICNYFYKSIDPNFYKNYFLLVKFVGQKFRRI